MRWRDLEKGIYKIQGHREKRNNYGVALILQLRTKDNENVFEVWAPQRLGDKILEEHYDFVFNEGLAKSTKTGYFYFKFSLL